MSSPNESPEQGNETKRRGWRILAALAGAAAIALAVFLVARPDDPATTPATDSSETDDMSDEDMSDDEMSDEPSDDMSPSDDMTDGEDMSDDEMDDEAAPGVYRDFSEDLLAESGYERNILFVHAPWCPECQAFEDSLTSAEIPDGTQFLKIDYDSNRDDLKQRYGVDIQSTFVEVDDDGEKVSLWVGYEKDRSLDTIFDGLSNGMEG